MKKIISVLLILTLSLMFCACGSVSASEESPEVSPVQTASPEPIATPLPEEENTDCSSPDTTQYECWGVSFPLPSYYNGTDEDELFLTYVESEDAAAFIYFAEFVFIGISDIDFETDKEDLNVYAVQSFSQDFRNATLINSINITIAGYPGIISQFDTNTDEIPRAYSVLFYDPDTQVCSAIYYLEAGSLSQQYREDFVRMLLDGVRV